MKNEWNEKGEKGKKDKEEEREYVFVVGPGAGVIRCQSRLRGAHDLRRRTVSLFRGQWLPPMPATV